MAEWPYFFTENLFEMGLDTLIRHIDHFAKRSVACVNATRSISMPGVVLPGCYRISRNRTTFRQKKSGEKPWQ